MGSVSPRYGSADPDPYQNVTDPQHCINSVVHTPEPLAGEVGTPAHLTHVVPHSCARNETHYLGFIYLELVKVVVDFTAL